MTVRVLFFSFAAERMNGREREVTVVPGTTVGQLASRWAETLGITPERLQYAVNEEWSPLDRVLAEGDVVAVIPPVSGG